LLGLDHHAFEIFGMQMRFEPHVPSCFALKVTHSLHVWVLDFLAG
jgi:hypothetical protein